MWVPPVKLFLITAPNVDNTHAPPLHKMATRGCAVFNPKWLSRGNCIFGWKDLWHGKIWDQSTGGLAMRRTGSNAGWSAFKVFTGSISVMHAARSQWINLWLSFFPSPTMEPTGYCSGFRAPAWLRTGFSSPWCTSTLIAIMLHVCFHQWLAVEV